MLVQVKNKKIVGIFSISDSVLEDSFLQNNPNYFKTDFVFIEEIDLYEYKNNTFVLVENWQDLKQAKEEAKHQNQMENNGKVLSITQVQARLYMLRAGLLEQVETLLENNTEAKTIWEYAQDIKRDNVLISTIGQALNLNQDQLDNMFLEASKIEV